LPETTPATDTLGPAPTAEADATQAPQPEATATSAPPANGNALLSAFIYPIAGACLPQGEQLMPNAPRAYRNGTHEGIDFYGVDNCVAIGLGTRVMAAKAGTIIRIDHAYADLTDATLNALFLDPTSVASFDAFRGRQVWIDHGDGIVTRYCHLSGVVGELQVGDTVAQGTTIAYVGESGTPGSVQAPGTEYHLHWEVRVGGSYLGAGEGAAQVRAEYLSIFEP
jgi:murein DD-endopeptidase MepM/ murein hydrolase activator NlpD